MHHLDSHKSFFLKPSKYPEMYEYMLKYLFKNWYNFGILFTVIHLFICIFSFWIVYFYLFFTFEFQIDHRLNSVGRDLSFMVQPSDFVKHLRKQLKKMHSYEDYLVGWNQQLFSFLFFFSFSLSDNCLIQ